MLPVSAENVESTPVVLIFPFFVHLSAKTAMASHHISIEITDIALFFIGYVNEWIQGMDDTIGLRKFEFTTKNSITNDPITTPQHIRRYTSGVCPIKLEIALSESLGDRLKFWCCPLKNLTDDALNHRLLNQHPAPPEETLVREGGTD